MSDKKSINGVLGGGAGNNITMSNKFPERKKEVELQVKVDDKMDVDEVTSSEVNASGENTVPNDDPVVTTRKNKKRYQIPVLVLGESQI